MGSITMSHHASPHFMIVGAQKAGTTSLFDSLSGHSHITPPIQKEITIDFFRDKDKI